MPFQTPSHDSTSSNNTLIATHFRLPPCPLLLILFRALHLVFPQCLAPLQSRTSHLSAGACGFSARHRARGPFRSWQSLPSYVAQWPRRRGPSGGCEAIAARRSIKVSCQEESMPAPTIGENGPHTPPLPTTTHYVLRCYRFGS